MFLIILLIYFIILILVEFIFIILSKDKSIDKSKEIFHIIELYEKQDVNLLDDDIIKKHGMIFQETNEDVDIKNFIGKFYIKNYYGFFINLESWNLMESKKLYEFNVPVNINIIKINNKEPIKYYISK